MSPPFFDAHSHQRSQEADTLTLRSYSYPAEDPDQSGPFSFGAHPWYANQFKGEDFKARVQKMVSAKNFLALGECGLDKIHHCPWKEQVQSFQSQLEVAREFQIPVVIIHCVRAYNEVLAQVSSSGFKGKLLFHDFNASKQMAQELLSRGHFLSLGKTLDRDNSKVRKYLSKEMLSNLLLESDDEEIKIEKRYEQLSGLLKLDQKTLKAKLWNNAITLFGQKLEAKL